MSEEVVVTGEAVPASEALDLAGVFQWPRR
jgi:hypothetical protein